MADDNFLHPRLAALYDPLDPDRGDLEPYVRLAEESGARRVLDNRSGTRAVSRRLPARGTDRRTDTHT
ncbi:hypothetical protein ACFWJY_16755, partial [Streptomyces anulatus]